MPLQDLDPVLKELLNRLPSLKLAEDEERRIRELIAEVKFICDFNAEEFRKAS